MYKRKGEGNGLTLEGDSQIQVKYPTHCKWSQPSKVCNKLAVGDRYKSSELSLKC